MNVPSLNKLWRYLRHDDKCDWFGSPVCACGLEETMRTIRIEALDAELAKPAPDAPTPAPAPVTLEEAEKAYWLARDAAEKCGQSRYWRAGTQAVLDLCRSRIPAQPIDPAKLLMDFNGESDAESIEDMRNSLKMQEVSVREPVDAEELAGHLRDFFYRDNVKSWVDVARLAIERCAGRSVEVDVVKLLTEHYGAAPAQTNLKSITRGLRAQGVAVKEASGG